MRRRFAQEAQLGTTLRTFDGDLVRAWRTIHHLERRWVMLVAGSWAALSLFAAVTVPIKYPYEAREQVVDSGVVIGLLVPLAVMNLVLDEGPGDLVRTASLKMTRFRFGVAGAYLIVASLMSVLVAFAVALPRGLVLADAILLASLSLLGTSLFGLRLGWLLPGAVAFAMSAPGLVPFRFNPLYNREIGSTFVVCVAIAGVAGMLAYLRLGAAGLRPKMIRRVRPARRRE